MLDRGSGQPVERPDGRGSRFSLGKVHVDGGGNNAVVAGVAPVAGIKGGTAADVVDDAAEETNAPPGLAAGPGPRGRGTRFCHWQDGLGWHPFGDAAAVRRRQGGGGECGGDGGGGGGVYAAQDDAASCCYKGGAAAAREDMSTPSESVAGRLQRRRVCVCVCGWVWGGMKSRPKRGWEMGCNWTGCNGMDGNAMHDEKQKECRMEGWMLAGRGRASKTWPG